MNGNNFSMVRGKIILMDADAIINAPAKNLAVGSVRQFCQNYLPEC